MLSFICSPSKHLKIREIWLGWWETLDHLKLELSLFSLSGMLIVFYLWVFEGFLQFNVCWTEIYGSREDLIREDYIKFLSYPSKWFCLFTESLAFMQCAVFICGLIFDICIIHVVTGIQVLSMISVSKRTLERMRNISLNSLVLYILVHVGHTPRLFAYPFSITLDTQAKLN